MQTEDKKGAAMQTLKLISATDPQYSATLLKAMNEQRYTGLFCDVTIIIQDRKFQAHKTILSASSTYFHQLFVMAGQVIELNFLRAEIFEHILNFIYSSKIVRIRSDLLEELISAGQTLGVKFIAKLATPLSQVKGLPGLSKEDETRDESSSEMVMPIISESFSISAEEFSKPADHEADSDDDVMFVSQTDVKSRVSGEVIDLETVDSVEKEPCKEPADPAGDPKLLDSSPLRSPDSSSNNSNSLARVSSGSTASMTSGITPELQSASQSCGTSTVMGDNTDILGVHKKQVFSSPQQGDAKIRLLDISERNVVKPTTTKKTVTLNAATEIDSISPNCKVYANIGENTYDIVPVKEDPGEGGSKSNKGKRSIPEIPENLKVGPNKKKSKSELDDHYELIMDGKAFYVCVVCKRPYVCLTSLRRHFNTHSWEKKYPCRYCDKVFPLAEYRTKHEIQHTGERRYQCLMCSGTFLNYQLLSNHCKQVHNQDPSGRKAKEDGEDNLYRLLPAKTVQMKPYSWTTDGAAIPFISEDGSVHHVPPRHEEVIHPPVQNRMLHWDNLFVESQEQMLMGGQGRPPMNARPSQGKAEYGFTIPETY
ncbi:transcriptional regulator Kaiso isoform X2 [Dunckerocampus dactyliophorus]|uniref:transcriptional regulator Kaiso isoform X2 n=1 Tax=Dunckerocampus dactyliophorus TaxID=161453 RepID=UPI0024070A85|nr:transcriptional regulator Kaiso isoform X2 [Dunckerocampus dactyliophorus]